MDWYTPRLVYTEDSLINCLTWITAVHQLSGNCFLSSVHWSVDAFRLSVVTRYLEHYFQCYGVLGQNSVIVFSSSETGALNCMSQSM